MTGTHIREGGIKPPIVRSTGKLPRSHRPDWWDEYHQGDLTVNGVRELEGLPPLEEVMMDEDDEIRHAKDGTVIKKRKTKKKAKKKMTFDEMHDALQSLPKMPIKENVDKLEESLDSISVCAEDDAIINDYFDVPANRVFKSSEEDVPLKSSAEIASTADMVPDDTNAWVDPPRPSHTDALEEKVDDLNVALQKAVMRARNMGAQLALLKDKMDEMDQTNRDLRNQINRLDR